tara:strand:+ start:117 stop:245 length:129 start_codon:yes stop_codon:yes gene_type:complete
MSREYWEETQLEDLYNHFKEDGYTDEDAEEMAIKTFYREETK